MPARIASAVSGAFNRKKRDVPRGLLPFNHNGIGGTLGLAGLADEAVLRMNRDGFLFSTHLLHLIDHKRACPKASPATDALFPADGNLLADNLFPLLIRSLQNSTSLSVLKRSPAIHSLHRLIDRFINHAKIKKRSMPLCDLDQIQFLLARGGDRGTRADRRERTCREEKHILRHQTQRSKEGSGFF